MEVTTEYLTAQYQQLGQEIENITLTMQLEAFKEMVPVEQDMMRAQANAMIALHTIMFVRINMAMTIRRH